MDKTASSNGLNAAAAYDLACRYNNLFQYNPAAVAACAAAYGNIFNNGTSSKLPTPAAAATQNTTAPFTLSANTNSVSSPSNSSVSSSNNSTDSSLNGHVVATASTESVKPELTKEEDSEIKDSTEKENNKTTENSFDSVTDEINDSIKSDDDINESLASQLKDLNEKSEINKPIHSRSSSISSLDSARSSISSFIKEETKNFNDFENENNDQQDPDDSFTKNQHEIIETEMISTTKQAITNCFDSKIEQNLDEDDYENKPSKKLCTNNLSEANQTSLGSILDSLTARCSPSPPSQSSPKPIQTEKLFKKVDDLKSKLSITEMDTFRADLINSVNMAIQQTFKKFFDTDKTNSPLPKALEPAVKTKTTPPPPPPSHTFSMSNLLDNNTNIKKSPSIRVGDLNKRKLSTGPSSQKPYNPHPEKLPKYSAQSLLNMPDPKTTSSRHNSLILNTHHSSSTPSLSSSSSTSSTSKNSMVNQFYSAALMQHQKSQNFSQQQPQFPINPHHHQQYNTPSLFAHQQQQHQLILAAAAAAGHNQSPSTHSQSPSYFNMAAAAAANRLFTPYLLDHQSHSSQSQQPLISTPNQSNKLSRNFQSNSFNGNPGLFHVPGKRRRTKVTDTRLSPRNNSSSVRSNSSSINNGFHGKSLEEFNSKIKNQSPSHSLNDNDDQENYNQEYEDNHKYMEQVKFIFVFWAIF